MKSDPDLPARSRFRWGALINRALRRKGALPTLETETNSALDSLPEAPAEDPSGVVTEASPREMIQKAAAFHRLQIKDVMVPRADIVWVDHNATLDELVDLFAEAAHSRLPICRNTLDDPIGMVHIKDILSEVAAARHAGDARRSERVLARLKRELLFVPPSMRLSRLLLKMQSTRIHLALVIDEYGGADGLVSIEDLLEQVVGDIEDEHDESDDQMTDRGGGVFDASARVPVTAAEETLGLKMALDELDEPVDTLGGLVIALLGRVPQLGEIVRHPIGVDIEVLDADPRRVKQVRLRRAPKVDARAP